MRDEPRYENDQEKMIKATPGAVDALRSKLAQNPGHCARLAIAGFG